MKKKYFSPSLLNQNNLPKIVSRRIFGARNNIFGFNSGGAAYKTDGGGDDTDGKRTELLGILQGKIDAGLATRATKEELEALKSAMPEDFKSLPLEALRALADDKTGAMAMLSQQNLEIQRLKATMTSQPKDMSMRSQIKEWLDGPISKDSPLTVRKAIEEIKSGVKHQLPALEIRAVASPMGTATVNPTNSPWIGRTTIEPGINDFLRAAPTFWDYITKGRTNSTTYGWVNKTNPQGAAAFIGPGVLKPGVSIELVAETSVAKKIADSAKTTTELLDDIDGMETFIEQELRYQVMIKVNSTLMSSAGSSTIPTGIRNLSVTYTLTTIKTISPNYMDAIRAVVAQMRSGYLTGEITVFINSIDAANMDLAKNNGGTYLLPPFVTADGRKIGGATIVEDNNVPIGYFQAAFLRFYRILIYRDFSVSWGWENDDFTRNLVTAVGEMRMHQFMNSIHTGAFVYDSFDNVVAAIDKRPEAPAA